jgi:transposase
MLKMSQVNYIRDLSNSGYRIAEISKKLKLDRKTVRKYLSQEDFSPTPPVKHPAPSKLDPYKPKILKWLAEDQHVWQKQQCRGSLQEWGRVLADEQMVAAMLDRLAHHGHLPMAGGRSYRMEHALMRQDAVVESAS